MLRYVKSAVGETDVPDDLPEFISQRRRWLNGSFFAATYAIAHVGQMMRSGHSFGRKVALLAQVAYNILNLVSSWFAIVSHIVSWHFEVINLTVVHRATSTCSLSSSPHPWKAPSFK